MSEPIIPTEQETARLTIAGLIEDRDRLQKQLLEAVLIIGPLADLAREFSAAVATDTGLIAFPPMGRSESQRTVRITVGHLRWAQAWRRQLAELVS
jgi:hypothetical protein